MNGFEYLANFYDEFVGADYSKIAHYINKKLETHLPYAHYGVDLGCGSGTLTYQLANMGYDMIGVDCSEAMLGQAVSKYSGSNILFIQQDMAELELYGAADFMVSSLDCINYLSDVDELKTVLKRCTSFLKSKGILIFDFNSYHKYSSVLNDKNFIYETDDVYCVWENTFDGVNMYYDLTYFKKMEDQYKRFDEYQKQTYFSIQQVTEILVNLGYDVLSLEDDYTNSAVDEQTDRIVITAQKRS